MQINNRNHDFKDMIVSNQRGTAPPAPTSSPHYLGLSIAESDIICDSTHRLALIKATPGTQYLTNIAIGTDSTPPSSGDTGLIAQTWIDAISLFQSVVPLTSAKASYIEQLYIPKANCSVHIKEIGLLSFNGLDLFCRQLLDFDNSVNPVNLIISWVLSFTTP